MPGSPTEAFGDDKSKVLLCFYHFIGLDAAGADKGALDGLIQHDFDALEIREHLTIAFTDDLGTGAAFFLFHTASFIFHPGCRVFAANDTKSHENLGLKVLKIRT